VTKALLLFLQELLMVEMHLEKIPLPRRPHQSKKLQGLVCPRHKSERGKVWPMPKPSKKEKDFPLFDEMYTM